MASGCIVPIRCIISIGVEEETTPTLPLLPVSDIDVMFIENANIQSEGESPMLTWTDVLDAGVGIGLVPVEVVPLLHPVKITPKIR